MCLSRYEILCPIVFTAGINVPVSEYNILAHCLNIFKIDMENTTLIKKHYQKNWNDDFRFLQLDKGPILRYSNVFGVLEFQPSQKRPFWTYATVGMSIIVQDFPMELHVFSSIKDESIVELLTTIAYYHIDSPNKLHLWDTVNFGRGWQNHSTCEFGLISLPYLDGPSLETFNSKTKEIKFYWLIPITKEEREFKIKYGVDSLEEKFERTKFNYLNTNRESVV